MRLKNSRWTMVMVGVIALLMVGTMVWASPPAGAPSAPLLVPIDAQNAHRVDNHHAAASTASKSTRANRVLWAQSNGSLHWKAMPKGALNSRYLNDDRQETISAAVTGGALLTVYNSGSGVDVWGLRAYGEDMGVYGYSAGGTGVLGSGGSSGKGVLGSTASGIGVHGSASSGTGVHGMASSGKGVYGSATSGTGVYGSATGGNAGYFQGNVVVTGLLKVGSYASAPTCDSSTEGSIYYNTTNNKFYGCDGSAWRALH